MPSQNSAAIVAGASTPKLDVVTARRLSSGYWHVRGVGPCNWAQPPHWPCDEATLRAHASPDISESFVRGALLPAGEVSDGDIPRLTVAAVLS